MLSRKLSNLVMFLQQARAEADQITMGTVAIDSMIDILDSAASVAEQHENTPVPVLEASNTNLHSADIIQFPIIPRLVVHNTDDGSA